MNDAAEFFREQDFPGKRMLGVGALMWGIWWLSSFAVDLESVGKEIRLLGIGYIAVGTILYTIGFWKAVKGKGYHPVLFLISFTGFIGLIVIFFLPNQNENQPAQVNPCNPPDNPKTT